MTGPSRFDRSGRAVLPPVVPADVSSALHALGIDHEIKEDEAEALCPNPEHLDTSPSWSCNLETGMHHCFSCGWGGSFVKLVALMRSIRYGEATAWVQTRRVRRGPDFEEVKRHEEAPRPQVSEADLWECTDPPDHELAARHISLESAQALEIRWHPRKGCWIFPVRDPKTDRLWGWQEKSAKVFRNRPKDVDKSRTVFGFRQLKQLGTGQVIVVESPLDVARFWTAGFRRCVSTFGIEFSDYQIYLLWEYADEMVFAPDNDVAGHRKIARWTRENRTRSHDMRVFDYGGAFDYQGRYATREMIVHPRGDGRDPGNLTDQELAHGIEWATPAWRTYFEGVNWWE